MVVKFSVRSYISDTGFASAIYRMYFEQSTANEASIVLVLRFTRGCKFKTARKGKVLILGMRRNDVSGDLIIVLMTFATMNAAICARSSVRFSVRLIKASV